LKLAIVRRKHRGDEREEIKGKEGEAQQHIRDFGFGVLDFGLKACH
jgi:hypothetical protein